MYSKCTTLVQESGREKFIGRGLYEYSSSVLHLRRAFALRLDHSLDAARLLHRSGGLADAAANGRLHALRRPAKDAKLLRVDVPEQRPHTSHRWLRTDAQERSILRAAVVLECDAHAVGPISAAHTMERAAHVDALQLVRVHAQHEWEGVDDEALPLAGSGGAHHKATARAKCAPPHGLRVQEALARVGIPLTQPAAERARVIREHFLPSVEHPRLVSPRVMDYQSAL